MLSIENSLGSGSFNRHWDIPDSIPGSVWGDKGYQSKLSVKNDYVHLVMNEAIITGGVPVMIAYQRCHEDANPDYLICQAYVNGATQTYALYKNTNYSDPARLVSPFDSSCSFTPVIEASPVSSRVAIAFVKPACDGSCWYLGDVAYMESMANGDDWIDGSNYPPADYNVTNYGCGYPEDERACFDLNACYDYRDSLHIVWCTVGFPEPELFDPGVSKLYHWSKETGIGLITTAIWGGPILEAITPT